MQRVVGIDWTANAEETVRGTAGSDANDTDVIDVREYASADVDEVVDANAPPTVNNTAIFTLAVGEKSREFGVF
jgi:hypothetical protein